MRRDLADGVESQPVPEDPVVNIITMTEDEFRDVLRAAAEEVRRERETGRQHPGPA